MTHLRVGKGLPLTLCFALLQHAPNLRYLDIWINDKKLSEDALPESVVHHELRDLRFVEFGFLGLTKALLDRLTLPALEGLDFDSSKPSLYVLNCLISRSSAELRRLSLRADYADNSNRQANDILEAMPSLTELTLYTFQRSWSSYDVLGSFLFQLSLTKKIDSTDERQTPLLPNLQTLTVVGPRLTRWDNILDVFGPQDTPSRSDNVKFRPLRALTLHIHAVNSISATRFPKAKDFRKFADLQRQGIALKIFYSNKPEEESISKYINEL